MNYEVTTKPWFGPKKRAKEFLAKRDLIIPPSDSITLILNSLYIDEGDVDFLRFIEFTNNEDNFHYTIVIIQAKSNPVKRDSIYFNADKCVAACGWYPLVQGERLQSSILNKKLNVISSRKVKYNLGSIVGFSSACSGDQGTSIRLIFEYGNILLDTGLPDNLIPNIDDKIAFISHSHSDHSGGIKTALSVNMDVYISELTFSVLQNRKIINEDLADKFKIISAESIIQIDDGIFIKFFSVPHCFGSVGFVLEMKELKIVYTGDIVIKTNRFNFMEKLLSISNTMLGTQSYLFLDSTMASRTTGASQKQASEDIISTLENKLHSKCVIFSRDPEQLIYSLIDIFHYVKTNNRNNYSFIFPVYFKELFRLIHKSFIKREKGSYDQILYGQYGDSLSAWGESRWLYWISDESEIELIEENSKVIIFMTYDDIQSFPSVKSIPYVTIGPIDKDKAVILSDAQLNIDSSPWTLHSSSDTLTESIKELSKDKINVILFHDFSKRLNKYIVNNNLNCDFVNSEVKYFNDKLF